MKFGYTRVSTGEQNSDLQIDQLLADGCDEVVSEVASGIKTNRPILEALLNKVRKDDVIVVWKLDRLGRSLKHLVDLVNMLMEKGVGLKSLQDPIDTTSAQGRLVFNIFASLAEFERDLIVERTQAGLTAARARGRKGGRPKGLNKTAQTKALAAEALYQKGEMSVNGIAETLSISKATLYKYLRHQSVKVGDTRRGNIIKKTQ